jgi:hypothetical protein
MKNVNAHVFSNISWKNYIHTTSLNTPLTFTTAARCKGQSTKDNYFLLCDAE